MPFLVAGLLLVGTLCLLNLVLTLAVVRRLRQHTEHLGRLLAGGGAPSTLVAGDTVGAFTATTIDGAAFGLADLAGPTLVGVFSPGCASCAEQLPLFAERARVEGGDRVLAVVVTDLSDPDTDGTAEEVERLRRVARVVVEAPGGPVTTALSADQYPTMYLLDGATVRAAGHRVADLPTRAVR